MHLRLYCSLSGIIAVLVQTAFAQSAFLPKDFGPKINSPYHELHPVLSADRRTLYFTRADHPGNGVSNKGADIWMSHYNNGEWSEAERSPLFNTGKYNAVLSITAEGDELLILNDQSLSLFKKQSHTWIKAQTVNPPVAPQASLSSDGRYLVVSNGNKVLIRERVNGSWGEPEAITGITAGRISSLLLTQGNRVLYFIAKRKKHRFDIFKTERLGEGWDAWSKPVPLNDTINSSATEKHLSTTPNGAWGAFVSTRKPSHKSDIYLVKLYEDQPYVLVKGRLINAVSKRVLSNKEVRIYTNGEEASDYTVSTDSGTYAVRLPFGKAYTLTAHVDHYKTIPYEIDAKADREFRQVKLDMQQTPLPYALVTGKLLIKNTGKMIPAAAHPKILVDGEQVDSAVVDEANGRYSINLNHGASYFIQVMANHFESLPEMVNLNQVDGYEEVQVDLHADAEKMAIVTGNIIDKRTGKPFADYRALQVNVEGASLPTVSIDSVSGVYELRVPLREKHTISAKASGYCPVYEVIDVLSETKEVKISRDLVLVPFEAGQSVRLNNVIFETGKTVLHESSSAALDRLIVLMNVHPGLKIEIGAHTDKSSKISTLSMAKAVANYLTSNGVAKNRITARGYASTKPVVPHASPDAKAQNRRIEFTILEK